MGRAKIYREQATYCAALLSRVRDPARRSLLEREFEDWLTLADLERARWLPPGYWPTTPIAPPA